MENVFVIQRVYFCRREFASNVYLAPLSQTIIVCHVLKIAYLVKMEILALNAQNLSRIIHKLMNAQIVQLQLLLLQFKHAVITRLLLMVNVFVIRVVSLLMQECASNVYLVLIKKVKIVYHVLGIVYLVKIINLAYNVEIILYLTNKGNNVLIVLQLLLQLITVVIIKHQ